ncbi:MAG: hypothetical protein H7Z41_05710 [Cytophagales bacterium]|nr:hypothetical protein [Armatimonadota bacterium]
MIRRSGWAARCCSVLVLLTGMAAHAQTAPDPAKKLGPGDPLPPVNLKFGRQTSEIGPKGVTQFSATGDVTLTYGDLRIHADKIIYTLDGRFIEATGSVSLVRGDESLKGERFTFYGSDGSADSERTVILSPPFYLSAERFTRGEGGSFARNARLVPSPDGRGEVSLTAREIQITADGSRAILRDMTLRLLGTRLLTIRHARIPLGGGDRDNTNQAQAGASLPLTLRASGIAGIAVGINLPFDVGPLSGGYGFEFTQRTPPQFFARLGRDLIPPESIGRERPSSILFAAPGGMGSRRYEGMSPVRQLALARPKLPSPDTVLDYDSILVNPDPAERPTRVVNRSLYAEGNLSGNRDIGSKRQGPLLLSRLPEARLSGSFPLVGRLPRAANNAEVRRFLKTPHLLLNGTVSAGRYREQRLQNDRATINSGRLEGTAGISMVPLLIGEHLLFRPQVTAHYYRYDSPGAPSYRFTESSATLDYFFYSRTMIGGSYIRRDQSGRTPFTFDQVDTRDEGQLRAQVSLPGGKFTLATQLRYDLTRSKLFDTEIAVAWRGKAIEPRFSYRTQNSQFAFSLDFPGLLP